MKVRARHSVIQGGVRGRSGFTLIETLVASSVLAVAAVAMYVPFSLAADHQRQQATQTLAATLAAQQMERLMTLSYDQIVERYAGGPVEVDVRDFGGTSVDDASIEQFTLTIEADPVTLDTGSFHVVKVEVTGDGVVPVTLGRLFAP